MAPNGTTSRKAPTGSRSSKTDDNLFGVSLFEDLNDYKAADLKESVRKGLPQVEKPGNWDSKVTGGVSSKDNDNNATYNINKIPASLAKAFPRGNLMSDKPDVLKCNHCKRPVSRHAMPAHIERCLNKKQEKQRKKKEAKDARDAAARKEKGIDSDDDDDDAKKTATKTGLTASKKRKAIDEGDDTGPNKKKKKKDDAKAKAPRPKAPVDVEKQCGVELPQGGQCARSLTCKSHSMGAKRAVPGRSAPYDKLLMEYQRKNQAKMQKAAFDANAPNPDDDTLPTGPVDSEEERDAVLGAISRSWGGKPIYQSVLAPLRRKYEYNRIKSMLGSALGGRGGSGLFGTGHNAGNTGSGFFGSGMATADSDASSHVRRPSMASNARGMVPPSRKPSTASAVGA